MNKTLTGLFGIFILFITLIFILKSIIHIETEEEKLENVLLKYTTFDYLSYRIANPTPAAVAVDAAIRNAEIDDCYNLPMEMQIKSCILLILERDGLLNQSINISTILLNESKMQPRQTNTTLPNESISVNQTINETNISNQTNKSISLWSHRGE